jgi:hypothetical protein
MHGRRGIGQCIIYVGLDVNKDSIAVAVGEAGLRGEVRDRRRLHGYGQENPRGYYQSDSSAAGHLTEDAPRRIKVRWYHPRIRESEDDEPSLHDRASCFAQWRLC